MFFMNKEFVLEPSNLSLKNIFINEWKIIITGVLICFFILNMFLYHNILPHSSPLLSYQADNSLSFSLIQRLNEGWAIDNPRSGFPFGSNHFDFPIPEFLELITLKFYTLFSFSTVQIIYLFYLTGFFLCFISSYITLRIINLNHILAFTCAIVYDFVPFHFLRIHHLFYTWYFIVPIYILLAYRLYFQQEYVQRKILFYFFSLVLLGMTGVYYALFGMITLSTAMLCRVIKNHAISTIKIGVFLNIGVILGIILATSPYLLHKLNTSSTPSAISRSPIESELYGFKMAQLLLPQNQHHSHKLRNFKAYYNQAFFLNNENSLSSLGLISAIGFVIALISILFKLCNVDIDPKIQFFSLLTLLYFLFGTIGGLGVIFSIIITPMIRCWNRISIFINFTTLVIFFIYLQKILENFIKNHRPKLPTLPYYITSILLITLALYDQTPAGIYSSITENQKIYQIDKNFIETIEHSVAPNSAIYQLPYMQYPEVPNLHQLEAYDLLSGFIFSKTLKWSFGGMKGHEGDLYYQQLAKKTLQEQIDIIKKMGFSGIYIDLRGYEDHGKEIQSLLFKLLGNPLLKREDDLVIFYKL